jgi:hypothetical protein
MPVKKEISLLPDEENVNTFSARAIKWVTTAGRFVMVFTELIVICAFLSRFWLDRTNSDLSEVVRQQKAILESTKDFEKEYSLLQKRLKLIKNFYQGQPQYQNKITSLAESTPLDITFEHLRVDRNPVTNQTTASIGILAYSESSIIDFITNLVLNPAVSSVDIEAIEKKPKDSKYTINLLLTFTKDQV